jgi:hypothetical protein
VPTLLVPYSRGWRYSMMLHSRFIESKVEIIPVTQKDWTRHSYSRRTRVGYYAGAVFVGGLALGSAVMGLGNLLELCV